MRTLISRQDMSRIFHSLYSKPLVDAWIAGGMQIFEFGAGRTGTNRFGQPVRIPDWSLHIQCPWRLLEASHLVVGGSDLYFPASPEPQPDNLAFDWERNPSRLSDTLKTFIERTRPPLFVGAVEIDSVGGLQIMLSGSYRLEAFPDASQPDTEHWRLLLNAVAGNDHFVCSSDGFAREFSRPGSPGNSAQSQ
jgi:hypothetical protein